MGICRRCILNSCNWIVTCNIVVISSRSLSKEKEKEKKEDDELLDTDQKYLITT
jgi:hypothetical protein